MIDRWNHSVGPCLKDSLSDKHSMVFLSFIRLCIIRLGGVRLEYRIIANNHDAKCKHKQAADIFNSRGLMCAMYDCCKVSI